MLLTGAGPTAKQHEAPGEGKAPWLKMGCPHASVLLYWSNLEEQQQRGQELVCWASLGSSSLPGGR